MIIKVLGSGCKNCKVLAENAEAAVGEAGVDAEIVKVTDFQDIMSYGVMSTPALVIDEQVVSTGRVLKTQDIVQLLREA